MPQIVHIHLTLAEARAVRLTMDNHIDNDDHQGQLALYGKTSTIHAASRASARIAQAILDTLSRKRH